MMVLGVGDYGVSANPGEIIKTLGLGSCIAIMCSDPIRKVSGMVHVALPDSLTNADRSKEKPGYFADTGIEAIFQAFSKLGYTPMPGKMQVKLVGGANILDPNNTFNIGKRNALAIKRLLWAKGFGPLGEDLGGTISRTVSITVGDGTVQVTSPGKPPWTV